MKRKFMREFFKTSYCELKQPENHSNGRISSRNNSTATTQACSTTPNGTMRFEVEEEIIDDSNKTQSSFERFCNCTSLHGWKYLSTSEMTLRVGWVAVVLASMGVASFFLGYSCNDFFTSTVQTTQDTSR